jgi:hypothetical protein
MADHRAHIGMLPGHMQDGMLRFIEKGHPVGGFLSALLSNDLKETFVRADSTNAARVSDFVTYLYNYAPLACWGSKERFEKWQEQGGLEGIAKKEAANV